MKIVENVRDYIQNTPKGKLRQHEFEKKKKTVKMHKIGKQRL